MLSKADAVWVQEVPSLTLKYAFISLSTLQNQSFIFPVVQLRKLRHKEYALFKVTQGVCDRAKSRIQLLPYNEALRSGLSLPKIQFWEEVY